MRPGLTITAILLIEWLLIVAEITDQFQFYVWAFLVVVMWSEAVNSRNPRLYPNRLVRITYFSMYFFMLLLLNKSFIYVQEIGLPLPEGG